VMTEARIERCIVAAAVAALVLVALARLLR
jgi:hypothetical protein